jgi:predicted GIY-YIG superfamily endonuclease
VDFSCFAFGPGFLRQLPGAAGVYVMKDRRGAVLYVGKSRNLKRRVASYFTPRALSDPKTARMHEGLYSIDIHRTDNEIEALILEMRLIKDFRPAINLQTEVHGRRAARHRGGSLLLFVVDSEQKAVKIYFFHDGVFAGRNSALMGRPPSKRLRKKIQSVFFTTGRTRKSRGEDWEKEIAFRWLAANRKRLNFLDVDEAGSFASVLELLRRYLCDPDRLARKVYYR